MDDASKQWMKDSMGLVPLDTRDGIKSFEEILRYSKVRLIILAGLEEKIKRRIEYQKENTEENSKTVVSKKNIDSLKDKTSLFLKEILAKETKVPINSIEMINMLTVVWFKRCCNFWNIFELIIICFC